MSETTETVEQRDEATALREEQAHDGRDTESHAHAGGDDSDAQATSEHGDAGEKLVPVTEAIRYRKRAQAAEQQITELNGRLEQLQTQLNEAQQTVTHLDRRQQIDAMLSEADAIDLETARLLTERAVEQMEEPDVTLAVDDLRRGKPYLFRQRHATSTGAMAARDDNAAMGAEQAAERAVSTGDRRDLLQYLRLRRRR